MPASANDADMSFRKLRRLWPSSTISLAPTRKFAVQPVLELRRVRQFIQAAPVTAPFAEFELRCRLAATAANYEVAISNRSFHR
jgi:hypothetical protein